MQNVKSLARMMLWNYQEPDVVHEQLPDSDLLTMERFYGTTDEYNVMFATARIAKIVADVRGTKELGI